MLSLKLGDTGVEVETWQRIVGADVDGVFGPQTDQLTRAWQAAHGLTADGIVGPETRAALNSAPTVPPPTPNAAESIPFMQARNYTKTRFGKKVSLVVIHSMESPQKPHTALGCARWFAGLSAPDASAHFVLDDIDTIQCVQESDTAWAAPGANSTGIHLEHAGYAAQPVSDWLDPYSLAMLRRSAALVADICRRYQIPIVKLSPDDLIAGRGGICGHVDVSEAFKKSNHYDPGGNFPWEVYLGMVRDAAGAPPAPRAEMPTVDETILT